MTTPSRAESVRTSLDSPDWILWHPKWNADKLDEHAVSMVIEGPLRLKNHEIRFDACELDRPDASTAADVVLSGQEPEIGRNHHSQYMDGPMSSRTWE
jgi:hypothetical protein